MAGVSVVLVLASAVLTALLLRRSGADAADPVVSGAAVQPRLAAAPADATLSAL
jgi:hypothetical protein